MLHHHLYAKTFLCLYPHSFSPKVKQLQNLISVDDHKQKQILLEIYKFLVDCLFPFDHSSVFDSLISCFPYLTSGIAANKANEFVSLLVDNGIFEMLVQVFLHNEDETVLVWIFSFSLPDQHRHMVLDPFVFPFEQHLQSNANTNRSHTQ